MKMRSARYRAAKFRRTLPREWRMRDEGIENMEDTLTAWHALASTEPVNLEEVREEYDSLIENLRGLSSNAAAR